MELFSVQLWVYGGAVAEWHCSIQQDREEFYGYGVVDFNDFFSYF